MKCVHTLRCSSTSFLLFLILYLAKNAAFCSPSSSSDAIIVRLFFQAPSSLMQFGTVIITSSILSSLSVPFYEPCRMNAFTTLMSLPSSTATSIVLHRCYCRHRHAITTLLSSISSSYKTNCSNSRCILRFLRFLILLQLDKRYYFRQNTINNDGFFSSAVCDNRFNFNFDSVMWCICTCTCCTCNGIIIFFFIVTITGEEDGGGTATPIVRFRCCLRGTLRHHHLKGWLLR